MGSTLYKVGGARVELSRNKLYKINGERVEFRGNETYKIGERDFRLLTAHMSLKVEQ